MTEQQSQKINIAAQDFLSEVERLKKKCNLQIEKILQLEEENKILKQKLKSLQEVDKMQLNDKQKKNEEYIKKWMYLVKKLHDGGFFIPYKNLTKNAKLYFRVERNIVEKIISSFFNSCEQEKEFYDFIAKMQFCRYEDGKYKFYDCIDGKNIQVYMIRKDIVELSVGEKIKVQGESLKDD